MAVELRLEESGESVFGGGEKTPLSDGSSIFVAVITVKVAPSIGPEGSRDDFPAARLFCIRVERQPKRDEVEGPKPGEGGVWPETYGSLAEATAFLRGAEVMASMLGLPGIKLPRVTR